MHAKLSALIFALVISAAAVPSRASSETTTDVDIVTAVDTSDSIGRYELWLQRTGLARALRHPEFLARLQAGRHGRVGIAILAWSSGSSVAPIVPWILVASAEDADRAARILEQNLPAHLAPYRGDQDDDRAIATRPERRTDTALAITAGMSLLQGSTHSADRQILNVLTNGRSNAGAPPAAARDAALVEGVVVNAIALGHTNGLRRYLEQNVIGGGGAFALEISDASDLPATLERKFLLDLIAATSPTSGWVPRATASSS
jgi:Protein of unknown function (DUF1194)